MEHEKNKLCVFAIILSILTLICIVGFIWSEITVWKFTEIHEIHEMEPNPMGGGYTFTGDIYYTVQFATRIEEFILNKVFEYCAIILLITDMIIFTYLLSSKKDIVELIALEKKKTHKKTTKSKC